MRVLVWLADLAIAFVALAALALCAAFVFESGLAPLAPLAAIYFLPSILACIRHHPAAGSILIVNAVFGWSVLGWIIALIWAANGGPAYALRGRRVRLEDY